MVVGVDNEGRRERREARERRGGGVMDVRTSGAVDGSGWQWRGKEEERW